VVDGSRPFTSARDPLEERLSRGSVVVALTKSDLGEVADPVAVLGAIQSTDSWAIPVSSLTGEGMIELRAALAVELGAGSPGGLASAIANPRHTDAITRARAALARAGNAADTRAPGEIVALELRESLAAIGEVSGRQASEELLERIFARFCIGK
jgi:tRNA modification GTPase